MKQADARLAIVLHPDDDVGVALRDLAAGTSVAVRTTARAVEVALCDAIPLGHKFALHPLAPGARIRKYGHVIGAATTSVAKGEHVHVHNMASLRARRTG